MQFGKLSDETTYSVLMKQDVWLEVFEWLRGISVNTTVGIHEIRGREIYANIMDEPTLKREDAVFEVHQKYVDLHFCISGDELIEYADPSILDKKIEFDLEKDVQLFAMGGIERKNIKLLAGELAIFYTGGAHAPRIRFVSERIKKVVVKIDKKLLS
jgi:YhcH/YjgK/YiaL family protein